MRVGAADAERRHARAARALGPLRLPRLSFRQQRHRARRPVDVRARRVHVQRRRQRLVTHRLHHLDDAGRPGGRLRVAHVRLDRAQPQRLAAVLPVGGQQGLRLDRVTQGGSGAVALDDVDVGRGQPGVVQRGTHHPLLRGAIGCGQPVGGAVLIDRRAADYGQHRVPQPLRVRQAFHDQDGPTLGPADAVGRARVGLASSVRRQSAMPAELHEDRRRGVHGRAAGQGQVALPRAQRLHGHVQGHQRRRARRVHRYRRALQPQHIGHPSRGDAGGHAGQPVTLDLLGEHAVALNDQPGEHASGAAAQPAGVNSAPLQRFPRQFEQHPMLGVHRERLARRDAEEGRIEVRDAVDEAAGVHVALVPRVGVRVVQPRDVPATVGGKLRDHVAAIGDHLPQRLRTVHATREAARHTDDRDRLVGPLQQRTVGALQALNLDQRFTQRFGRMLELINHHKPRLILT